MLYIAIKRKWITMLFPLFCLPALVLSQTLAIRPVLDVNLCFRPVGTDYKTVATQTTPLSTDQLFTRHQIELLTYYKALGFTHICYMGSYNRVGTLPFSIASSTWSYSKGTGTQYTDGAGALSFRTTKAAFEAYGLKMIPILFNTLSHADWEISQDPSLGEFLYNTTTKISNYQRFSPRSSKLIFARHPCVY